MKEEYFRVYFHDDVIEVYALSFRAAAILAMAKRIEDGKRYMVNYIEGEKETRDYDIGCLFCGYAGQ